MDINQFDKIFPTSTYRVVHNEGKYPIDNNIYTLDEALKTIADKGGIYRLGWMVDSSHIVVDVDCDHELDKAKDKAKRVFNVLVDQKVNTFLYGTEHGIHCIFNRGDYEVKSVVKAMCGLGVRIDIRVQGSYVILPHNDPKRKWWNRAANKLDEIPYYLKVITKTRNIDELWDLAEGQGRNDAMFRHLNAMKTSQLFRPTAEQLKESILLCNKFILKDPMSDRELYSTILRPENLVIKENKNSAAVCAEYAIQISQENNIIYTNNNFFMIRDESNIYRFISDEEMDRFIYLNYTKELASRSREEIIKALRHEVFVPWEECNRDPYDVPFLNGVYNVKSGGFRPALATDYITYVLPHRYNPMALNTEMVKQFCRVSLEDDTDKIVFFFTMLGYCMTRSTDYQVFFVFKGRGGTGKSTLLNIVNNVLGEENVAHLQLTDFMKDFGLEVLFNKLANLGDDISGTKLVDSQTFKKASSGDMINVDRKHKTAMTFAPFAKIIFTSNSYPKIADKSRAMERRMRIVSSDKVIAPKDIIPDFMARLGGKDYEAIINGSLRAITKLVASGEKRFPDPNESLAMKEKMREIGDHVYAYMKFTFADQDLRRCLHDKPVMSQYGEFQTFCRDRGYQQPSLDTFREQICDILEYTVEIDNTGTEKFMVKEEL